MAVADLLARTIGFLTGWVVTPSHLESEEWMPRTCNHCAECKNPVGEAKEKIAAVRKHCNGLSMKSPAYLALMSGQPMEEILVE